MNFESSVRLRLRPARTRCGAAIVLKCHAILHVLLDGHNPHLCEKFEFSRKFIVSKALFTVLIHDDASLIYCRRG